MMRDAAKIFADVARETGISVGLMRSRCRTRPVCVARYEVIRRLDATGRSSTAIGRLLNRDHTAILFALGRCSRAKPLWLKLGWHKPEIKHLHCEGCRLCVIRRPPPPKPLKKHSRFLMTYAGVDMREYHFKERP